MGQKVPLSTTSKLKYPAPHGVSMCHCYRNMQSGFWWKNGIGVFECFSTFSAVVFNAVLGVYLLWGRFDHVNKDA